MTDTEAPYIQKTETGDGYTVRLRANCGYTQKEGWHPKDITVEYTGPADTLPTNLFRDRTVDVYDEADAACRRMNQAEGR